MANQGKPDFLRNAPNGILPAPMTIREHTRYPLPAEEVWPFLERAELFIAWNPKIRKLHRDGPFRVGDEFWTEYSLSQKLTTCSTRVTGITPLKMLALEHTRCQTQTDLTDLHVRETFELEEGSRWTHLYHTIRIRHHGLPFYIVILFWLVTTFGTTVEADTLEHLLSARVKARLLGQAGK